MFCTNCGKEVEANTSFCTNCGNKVGNNEKKGTIIFVRESQFYGVAVPLHIYLDGIEVASLWAGNEQKIDTSIGKHRVALDVWSGNGQQEIEITEANPNIKITVKLGMGALTSKPKIIRIENV